MDERDELMRLYDACLRHNGGRLLLEGTAARAGVVTANGRVYPPKALRRAARQFSRGAVKKGVALGELDHPSYASSLYRSVSLANASHAVLQLEWQRTGRWWRADDAGGGGGGGELRALVEVLPTPSGLLLWALAARGAPLAVSQRCWAEVEWRLAPAAAAAGGRRQQQGSPHQQQQEQQQQQQQRRRQVGFVSGETLELLTFDFVPDPANAGAWLRPVARRVVGDGALSAPHPSAVALAHLGAGSVSPARAVGLPTAAAVVEALRGAGKLARVGALDLRSHYSIAGTGNEAEEEAGGQRAGAEAEADDGDKTRGAELAALVALGAPAEASARSLPAHWRRFAERALKCEARERARQREREQEQECGGDDEDESDNDGGGGGCLPRWLSLSPASWRRQRARGRRRRGAAVAPLSSAPDAEHALLPPPSPPAPAARDEEQGGAPSPLRLAAEVDAVLWSRANKARDVKRQALLRRLPFPVPGSEDESERDGTISF